MIDRNEGPSAGTGGTPTTAHVDLPLRGLASEGASPSIERALRRVPGVLRADVHAADFRAHVEYDPTIVTPFAIACALRDAAGGNADPDGHTHEGERA